MTDEERAKKRTDAFYKKYAQDMKRLQLHQVKALFLGEDTFVVPAYFKKNKVKNDKA